MVGIGTQSIDRYMSNCYSDPTIMHLDKIRGFIALIFRIRAIIDGVSCLNLFKRCSDQIVWKNRSTITIIVKIENSNNTINNSSNNSGHEISN